MNKTFKRAVFKRTYHDFWKKCLKLLFLLLFGADIVELWNATTGTLYVGIQQIMIWKGSTDQNRSVRGSHNSSLSPHLITAHGSLNLFLNIGITIPNNFQDKLSMLIEKNPNLELDDHFYDDYYDDDYFNAYWNQWTSS